jgi:hypothetical protein
MNITRISAATAVRKLPNTLLSLADLPFVSSNATKFAKRDNSSGVIEPKVDNVVHLKISILKYLSVGTLN